ncbi:MAG: hypothetical protein E7358_06860 [Clostridiales bacterium]|nr:hypothetical protein [Clostridiales bacterium]
MKFYLGIDLGTTGTKTILFDSSGKVLGKGYKGYDLITPKDGFFEQNAEDWYDAVVESTKQAIDGFDGEVEGVSFSAQGGSFLFVDVDSGGNVIPLTNAITWMDKRGVKEAEQLNKVATTLTGDKFGASSMVAKYLWFRNNAPEIYKKAKYVLSTSDYIYARLTKKFVIDYTSAAMMGVYDPDTNAYSEKMIELACLKEENFPKIVQAGEFIGNASEDFKVKTGLKGKVSLYVGLHDQFAASLGANYFSQKDVIISTGTTWVVFARNDERIKGNFAYRKHPAGDYGYFNSAISSGTVYSWEKNLFGISYKEMDELAGEKQIDENLLVYPFVSGNGGYRGQNVHSFSIKNANFKHEKGDIFKATMEGVAFEIKQIINIYKRSGFEIGNIIVTGGATRSDVWMGILSDVLGERLYLSEQADGCCFGAFSVAKKGESGDFTTFEFTGRIVEPNAQNALKYIEKFDLYNKNL